MHEIKIGNKIFKHNGNSNSIDSIISDLDIKDDVCCALIDDNLCDTSTNVDADSSIQLITFNDDYGKNVFWHSSAHLLAAALKDIYGSKIKLCTGPATENGFYYDVDFSIKFDPSDFKTIESKMIELAKRGDAFIKKSVSKHNALEYFKNERNEYKCEIINELQDGSITFYSNGNFTDLCRGPHIPNTSMIRSIRLLGVSGVYWRGDENNKQVTRIYGISFPHNGMMEEYLNNIEEAKNRDHQKIGKTLKLYTFSESVGIGLPLWLPRGTIMREQLINFIKNKQSKAGYKQVVTPHIGNKALYVTSGHYEKYGNSSFRPILTPNENEEYFLKPMNCPHHCEIYRSEMRSYRDLPLRLAEFGTVYRYEQHGELHGLARTRCFTQDDAHIFCRKDQVEGEFENVIDLICLVFRKLGFNDFTARLSLRDKNNHSKYIGDMSDWDDAEAAIEQVAIRKNLPVVKIYGEAAFYGPKLDFIVRDAIGRKWQLGTVQLDYQLPIRFNLSYINENNEKARPVMIHRAPFGSIERITAIILEHTAGKLPLWLAPDQVTVLPISVKVNEYANRTYRRLYDRGIRTIIDDRNEKINRKIKDAEVMKIPIMVILGEQEERNNSVSVRYHGSSNNEVMTVEDMVLMEHNEQ